MAAIPQHGALLDDGFLMTEAAVKDNPQEGKTKEQLETERKSVVFGRQDPKRPAGSSKKFDDDGTASCFCLDKIFGLLMGNAGVSSKKALTNSQIYSEPQPLKRLPPIRKWDDMTPELKGSVRVAFGSCPKEAPGWENQDSAMMCAPFTRAEDDPSAEEHPAAPRLFFGVFDGHGRHGHEASQVAASRLPSYLSVSEHLSENPQKALRDAVLATDEDIYRQLGPSVEYSGSTGVVVFYDGIKKTLYMANVGDSRAVLGRRVQNRWEAIPLTEDAKPDLGEELERIKLCGGYVAQAMEGGESMGPPRVWEDQSLVKPGLAVSRSLGDGCARACGVIADPTITEHKLRPEDRFLLIGSDGIWDALGNQQAVQIASMFLDESKVQIAPKALTNKVRQHEESFVDDTTIIVVVLPQME
eukprot:CAMPEP_0178442920 /NCGR_PEP_ID=MMETSP0689_2-20121128/38503_1 /TAXON_ID=160604 /ORGANISM="Amphidinium massartii, Strain CS-259" /LENGTH=413 /DNA_ID=CAMNT_0020066661 /DNA_START=55 /DNA_END=1296 /DNA_ORIENTATION=+